MLCPGSLCGRRGASIPGRPDSPLRSATGKKYLAPGQTDVDSPENKEALKEEAKRIAVACMQANGIPQPLMCLAIGYSATCTKELAKKYKYEIEVGKEALKGTLIAAGAAGVARYAAGEGRPGDQQTWEYMCKIHIPGWYLERELAIELHKIRTVYDALGGDATDEEVAAVRAILDGIEARRNAKPITE